MIIMKAKLADDSALIPEGLQEFVILCKQVKIIVLCDNGTKAMEAILNLRPNLAIVDLELPGLIGMEAMSFS